MVVSNIIGLASVEHGFHIKTAETHGLAQRSGSIYTHIRISKEEQVFSSLIPYGEGDMLLALEAIEALRNVEYLKKGSTIILNDYIWHPIQETFERVKDPTIPYITMEDIAVKLKEVSKHVMVVNALDLANKAGNLLTINVVLLGILLKQKSFPISIEQVKQIIPKVVPHKAIEANLKALDFGYNISHPSFL